MKLIFHRSITKRKGSFFYKVFFLMKKEKLLQSRALSCTQEAS